MTKISNDINTIASKYDGKAYDEFLFGFISLFLAYFRDRTFGMVSQALCQNRRGAGKEKSAGNYDCRDILGLVFFRLAYNCRTVCICL